MTAHGRHKSNPRYPAKMREFARRAYIKGHSAYRIRKFLLAQGCDPVPSASTLLRWVDDEYRETERLKQLRGRPPGPKRAKLWEVRLDRLRQLRGAGLSFTAIAAVARLDFEIEINPEQVRAIFRGWTSDRTVAHLLHPAAFSDQPKMGRPLSRKAA